MASTDFDEERSFEEWESEFSDPQGYSERARKFWSIYVKEAEQHDKNMTETWKADMDSTLIFAGLFSAAVTAFLIDGYKLLQPDSGDETKDLLKQILAVQIVGASLNTSAIPVPAAVVTPAFEPPASAIAVNVLWFLSLSCSLATALGVTLVQQWIRDYLQRIQDSNQPQLRATDRGIMFSGIEKWKMNDVVEYIPILLHFSLFFFFTGLCIFLWNISKPTAAVVMTIIICCTMFYIFATIVSLLDLNAPYETPLSEPLRCLWEFITDYVKDNTSSQVDEDSADSESLHKAEQERMQVVSWVYDRTNDDYELQELVESIPGLLSTQDGRYAWEVFLAKSAESAQELHYRTVCLLKSCSTAGYLDPKHRQLRTTLCIDALLALSSFFPNSFYKNSLSNAFKFDEYIQAPWEDDGTLATKAACTEALFRRRSLLDEIPRMKSSYRDSDFHGLANRADQALRDIDDLRGVLEDVLQQSEESESALSSHRSDIENLLKIWMDVVESLNSVILDHIRTLGWSLPQKFQIAAFLPWYSKLFLDRAGFFYLVMDNQFVHMIAYHILGYLRLHNAYPIISGLPISPLVTTISRGLWEKLEIHGSESWHVQCSGLKVFKLSSSTEEANRIASAHLQNKEPINHNHTLLSTISRELQPVISLLGIVNDNLEKSLSLAGLYPKSHDYCSGHLMLLITRAHGPFSLAAMIFNAIVEDEGTIGGFLMLINTLKFYKPIKPFKPSIIKQWLKTIFPCLLEDQPPESLGSQVLFVLALLEILVWECEWSSEHPFPFSGGTIQHLINWVGCLHHQLPVELLECAFGVTSHDNGDSVRESIGLRAMTVSSIVEDRRKSWIRSQGDRREN